MRPFVSELAAKLVASAVKLDAICDADAATGDDGFDAAMADFDGVLAEIEDERGRA
jgi:hypothetical protein